MMSPEETKAHLLAELTPKQIQTLNRWLARGDGIAAYRNEDMNSVDFGGYQYVSFGSKDAQLEVQEAPKRLPDIGTRIGWRYSLVGQYRGEILLLNPKEEDDSDKSDR